MSIAAAALMYLTNGLIKPATMLMPRKWTVEWKGYLKLCRFDGKWLFLSKGEEVDVKMVNYKSFCQSVSICVKPN